MSNTHSPITGQPYPDFFGAFANDPKTAAALYLTREMEVAAQADAYRALVKPAAKDKSELGGTACLVNVDFQTGFVIPPGGSIPGVPFDNPGGTLCVPGAVEDVWRTCKFILDNLPYLNQIINSLDTHRVYQIFHQHMWRRVSDGKAPPPFTALVPISGVMTDPVTGDQYMFIRGAAYGVAYGKALEAKGSSPLTIWPYHCRVGSTLHPLVPLLSEVTMFHEIARQTVSGTEVKGYQEGTESYGIAGDEVGEVNGTRVGEEVRTAFIQTLLDHDVVVLAGEASSHCVRSTVNQIIGHFRAVDPALVEKLYVLRDCTSPVPAIPGFENDASSPLNFPAVADAAFDDWKNQGVNIVTSDQDFLKDALAA